MGAGVEASGMIVFEAGLASSSQIFAAVARAPQDARPYNRSRRNERPCRYAVEVGSLRSCIGVCPTDPDARGTERLAEISAPWLASSCSPGRPALGIETSETSNLFVNSRSGGR